MAEQLLHTVSDVDNLSRTTRDDQQERVQFLKVEKKKKIMFFFYSLD